MRRTDSNLPATMLHMTLVFIYGPPAVGKTTVGSELAKLVGYRFFYNHLTVPAAKALFPDSEGPRPAKEYTQLLHSLRLTALDAAAAARLNTIFTIAYSGIIDDPFVAEIVAAYEQRGGTVHFVELHVPEAVLLKRVVDPSRIALHMGKLTNPEHLRAALATRDMYHSVPYPSILKLNTAELAPLAAAQRIVGKFGLDQTKYYAR